MYGGGFKFFFGQGMGKKISSKGLSMIFKIDFDHTFDCLEIMRTIREFVLGVQNIGVSS